MRTTRRAVTVATAVVMVLTATACDSGSDALTESSAAPVPASSVVPATDGSVVAVTAAPSTATRVIVDYSPTVSDVGALLYLAAHDDVDLLAVTLAGTGEADCEPGLRATHELLRVANRVDVPIGCGRDAPLVGTREWPEEWKAAANAIADLAEPMPDPPAVAAEELLASTLEAADSPVTIVTLGPLTNLGALLAARPELAAKIEQVVVMGGALRADGNVEAAPSAEWNLYIDPESVRITVASGVPVLFVALDATNDVPWEPGLVARIGTLATDAAEFEHALISSQSLEGIYLWDELAAIAVMNPDLIDVESTGIIVDDAGALERAEDGTAVDVAIGADAPAVTDELLRVLAGGTVPTFAPLTDEELAYFETLAAINAAFQVSLSQLYEDDPTGAGAATLDLLADMLFDNLGDLADDLRGVVPPVSLATPHAAMVDSLGEVGETEDATRQALAGMDDGPPIEQLLAAAAGSGTLHAFEQFLDQCHAIEAESLARGGPAVCEGVQD